jgi:hypothetical protein
VSIEFDAEQFCDQGAISVMQSSLMAALLLNPVRAAISRLIYPEDLDRNNGDLSF